MKTVHEAYFLQILKHPNVLAHKRTMVRKGTIVLATEYCDLGELHALLTASRRPLSERFVRHALLQCALGLSHMHARHVAHRDIKPENILVASGGYFKVPPRPPTVHPTTKDWLCPSVCLLVSMRALSLYTSQSHEHTRARTQKGWAMNVCPAASLKLRSWSVGQSRRIRSAARRESLW